MNAPSTIEFCIIRERKPSGIGLSAWLAACRRLSIGVSRELHFAARRPINNRPQDTILPHGAARIGIVISVWNPCQSCARDRAAY
jgi:hypothetical protein